ncbi:VCBS repeat-containing protein [Rudanella lutea]|uniref:VCBS repeat-containing protein n=1 Tax=Rudanella lutea TaxID=451374 RepID=UPI000381F5F2|nr:VCBS repeat-containing protein [Rudanella lutea]
MHKLFSFQWITQRRYRQSRFDGWLLLMIGGWLLSLTVHAQLFRPLNPLQTGITFRNDIDETESLNVLAYEYFFNGAGVAVGDFNNDGLQDIFFTANLGSNKLYLNEGKLNFKDVTAEAGEGLAGREGGWKTGVSLADVNGDGWLDIYVCYSGKNDATRRNQLFINETGGKDKPLRFVERAKEYRLDDPGYNTQAVFFDYDKDGDLDVFLLHHNIRKYDNMELARLHEETDELAGNRLLENVKGRFINATQRAGIHQYPLTFGLGVAVADVNLDGWPDIYVTNDYNEPDYLYINQKDGTFRDDTEHCFRHLAQFSMGVDIADFNNDGLPDVMSLDMLPEDNRRQKLLQLQENYESFELMTQQGLQRQYMRNMLQLNNGDGTFSEIAQTAGVSNTDWSWAPLMADFDNDGYKDLFITNGYLRDYTNKDFLRYWGDYKIKKAINREPVQLMDLVRAMPSTKVPNYIFSNNRDLTFTNRQQDWGFTTPTISSGAAYADLDNDGDLEIIINNINETAYVYQNMAREQAQNTFLQVRLLPTAGNKQAIGAQVKVYAGGQQQYQELSPVRGYLSTQPLTLHFGLGKATLADSVRISWPDGSVQKLTQVAANQVLEVQQSAGKPETPVSPKTPAPLFAKATPAVSYTHVGITDNDFKRQPLMLWMYSHTGPVLAKGDVNRDGLEDLFVSGDGQKKGGIWLQQKDGSFRQAPGIAIGDETNSAIVAAVFFDANGDGADDLYVAKGGYSLFEPLTPALQDELYLNDGKGNLRLSAASLPNLSASSKSCVRPADFDGDGDIDLFVGGRVVPGRYPEAPHSYLLQNGGKGLFKVMPSPFATVGMVTDAQWADLDGDNRPELVLTGEFMPIKVYQNTKTGFVDKTTTYFPEPDNGFWQSLLITDLNGDGRKDIVAGNLGTNSQLKFSRKEPAELYYADFDKNGSIDPFFCFYVQGVSYPFVSRDELNDQIYAMRKRFGFYKDYADAPLDKILTPEELKLARKLTVTENQTCVFLNEGGRFTKQVLPIQAQLAPVTQLMADDFNGDGHPDLLLLGNKSDNRLKLGSMDANYGCLLTGDGKGNFTYVSQPTAGLSVRGDVKSVVSMKIGQVPYWLIGAFNQPLQAYKREK